MSQTALYAQGQRVRINEEEEPVAHVGKMAVVERVEFPEDGEPVCVLRVDRIADLVSLPQRYLEPIATTPSSLLANDLYLPWDLDDPHPRLQSYTKDRWLAGKVVETLLFYNRVVVPTVDYSIIVPLVHWLGIHVLVEMLEAEALSFVRFTGTLGYSGNGVGLVNFELRPGDKPEPWWMRAAWCPPREAVALQLKNRLSGLQEHTIDDIAALVEMCSVDTVLPQFKQKVEEETYRDILGSDILTAYFSIRNTDVKRLSGVQANQLRVFSSLVKPAVAGDEIDITLRLAMLNLEAYLAEEASVRDMVTDRNFGLLLDAKVSRFTGGAVARESFSQLIDIEGLPDVASSVAADEVGLAEVWKFRNTNNAGLFREWFDQVGPTNPTDVTREYVKALKTGGLWRSGRAKVIKFIVVQAIGVALAPVSSGVSILAALGLSATDSFLLEKIRLGNNPRYFMDELRHQLFSG